MQMGLCRVKLCQDGHGVEWVTIFYLVGVTTALKTHAHQDCIRVSLKDLLLLVMFLQHLHSFPEAQCVDDFAFAQEL